MCVFAFLVARGAAGRLMRLEDTQMLLDDFGIPLQINSSSDSKEKSDILVCFNLSAPTFFYVDHCVYILY